MSRKYLIVAAIIALASCSAPASATRTLEVNGYTNIEITGYALLGCGRDDTYSTGFIATAPNGVRVRGVVCGGVFKGDTIRLT